MRMKHVIVMVVVMGLSLAGYGWAQGVVWPRHTALVRAIDNDPGRALDWLAQNLTEAQRAAFVEWMVPITEESRATELERARVIVETYAGEDAAETVTKALDAEIVKLRPVDIKPVEEIKGK